MTTIEQLADEIYALHCDIGRLEQENATLRQQLEDMTASMGRVKELHAKTFEVGKRWMAKAARFESENTKLRELLADTLMQPRDYCKKYGIEYESWDSANAHLDARMRELGVEVTE